MKLLPLEEAESTPPSFDLAGLAAADYIFNDPDDERQLENEDQIQRGAEAAADGAVSLKLAIVRLGQAGGKVRGLFL